MADRSKFDDELDQFTVTVTEAKRKATQREQNLQRQISQLSLKLDLLKEETELARNILAGGGDAPMAAAAAPDGSPSSAPMAEMSRAAEVKPPWEATTGKGKPAATPKVTPAAGIGKDLFDTSSKKDSPGTLPPEPE